MVHPQHWPEDLDYAGRWVRGDRQRGDRDDAGARDGGRGGGHVTMLQRSPTYVLALPALDPIARPAAWLPERASYWIMRWKQNLAVRLRVFQLSQRRPELVKRLIRKATLRQLPPDVDVDIHFKPVYDPWDQRLCLVPNGDLFRAIRHGRASVVTDTIDTLHRERRPAVVRRRAGGGRRRHRDRLQPQAVRWRST